MKRLIITLLLAVALVGCQPPDDPCNHEAEQHVEALEECPDISEHSHLQEAEHDEEGEHEDEHHDE